MTLRVLPEGLVAASAAVEVIVARLAAAHAAAGPLIGAVIPPAADPVSLQTAAGFSVRGAQHNAVAAQGVTELSRAAMALADAGAGYTATDAAGAASYLVAPGIVAGG